MSVRSDEIRLEERVREGGILPVDKPVGITSHQAVGRARRALDTRRIGHAGTLDPFASGLLLLCIDSATRLSEYLSGLDKAYEATMVLGRRTDTLDPEGEVVERDDAWRRLDREGVQGALAGLVGEIQQVPPQYSAKKVGGEAMYRKARRGERVELKAVSLWIRSMELLEMDLPRVRFRTVCSSGTYVRALARDLGEALGTCGHLVELRRTAVGRFEIGGAVPLEALEDVERVASAWISPLQAVAHLPAVRVGADEARRLAQGQWLDVGTLEDGVRSPSREGETEEAEGPVPTGTQGTPGQGAPVAVEWDGRLVAVAELREERLWPRKVFVRV